MTNPSGKCLLCQGLGTSTAQDAKKYFSDLQKHKLPFMETQQGDRELIDLAFNKKKADDRKEWLRQFRVRLPRVPFFGTDRNSCWWL
jgi:DNA gyrase/topoisomerase IV subunit B